MPLDNVSSRPSQAYELDPVALLAALAQAGQTGETLHAIVHSHTASPPEFSSEDRAMALTEDGRPLWPGVRYLIVAARQRGVGEGKLYCWDGGARLFREEQVIDFSMEF